MLNPGRDLAWGWYHEEMCRFAEWFATGRIRQALILVPPGTTKTTILSVCLPAWLWSQDPSARTLIASTTGDNAKRDSMATRQIVNSELYRTAYMTSESGQTKWALAEDQNEKDWFNTTANGYRIAVSVGSSVVGKKGDRLIMDDPNDARDVHSVADCKRVIQWFGEGFFNRVNDFKTASYLVVGQHTGTTDLQSHLLKQGGWDVLRLPEEYNPDKPCRIVRGSETVSDTRTIRGEWLRPQRFGEDEKERALRTMGPLAYSAQHNQSPLKREGRMFDRARVRLVTSVPVGTVAVRYWDTAASTGETACYSAGVLMGRTPQGRFIVIDLEKGRWNPSDRNNVMRTTGFLDMHRQGIQFLRLYWEKGTADSGVERDANLLSFLAGLPCEADPARGSKDMRAEPFSAQWAGGNVDILIADWNEDYLDTMESFPGPYKDDADASSGAFNKLSVVGEGEPVTAEEEDTHFGRLPKGTFRAV